MCILIGSVEKKNYTNIGACCDKRIYPYILNWAEMNDLALAVCSFTACLFPFPFLQNVEAHLVAENNSRL